MRPLGRTTQTKCTRSGGPNDHKAGWEASGGIPRGRRRAALELLLTCGRRIWAASRPRPLDLGRRGAVLGGEERRGREREEGPETEMESAGASRAAATVAAS